MIESIDNNLSKTYFYRLSQCPVCGNKAAFSNKEGPIVKVSCIKCSHEGIVSDYELKDEMVWH